MLPTTSHQNKAGRKRKKEWMKLDRVESVVKHKKIILIKKNEWKGTRLGVKKNQKARNSKKKSIKWFIVCHQKVCHSLESWWLKLTIFIHIIFFYDKTDCNDCQFNITAGFLPLIINGTTREKIFSQDVLHVELSSYFLLLHYEGWVREQKKKNYPSNYFHRS